MRKRAREGNIIGGKQLGGFGVEASVGLGRTVLAGVGVGAGIDKILPTPIPVRSRRLRLIN